MGLCPASKFVSAWGEPPTRPTPCACTRRKPWTKNSSTHALTQWLFRNNPLPPPRERELHLHGRGHQQLVRCSFAVGFIWHCRKIPATARLLKGSNPRRSHLIHLKRSQGTSEKTRSGTNRLNTVQREMENTKQRRFNDLLLTEIKFSFDSSFLFVLPQSD